jgi:hypothetical protein
MVDIPGYEGLYQINENGDVRSVYRYRQPIKWGVTRGYPCVNLYLARIFDVSNSTIYNIINYKTWTHLII